MHQNIIIPTKELKLTIVKGGNKQLLLPYLKELWLYRALLWVFTIRDIKTRYSQTLLGAGWIVFSPLMTVGVFTLVFGYMIKVPSDNLPYLLFYLAAIIPWQSFSSMLMNTVTSLEANRGLVTKIYLPRVLFAGSYVLSAAVDYLVGLFLMLFFSILYSHLDYKFFIVFPFLLFIQIMFAMGIGLFLSPLSTKYRDVKLIIPLALQLYYFANPILYSASVAPNWLHYWYALNPMSMIINSYREILKGNWPSMEALIFGFMVSLIVFIFGFIFFKKQEQTIVDAL